MSEKEIKHQAKQLYARLKPQLDKALLLYTRKHIAAVIREVANLVEKPKKKKLKKKLKKKVKT